jgi:hypothetical protein
VVAYPFVIIPAPSPKTIICFHSLSVSIANSRMLHKWNHMVFDCWDGPLHSALCPWDPSRLSYTPVVHFFSCYVVSHCTNVS